MSPSLFTKVIYITRDTGHAKAFLKGLSFPKIFTVVSLLFYSHFTFTQSVMGQIYERKKKQI